MDKCKYNQMHCDCKSKKPLAKKNNCFKFHTAHFDVIWNLIHSICTYFGCDFRIFSTLLTEFYPWNGWNCP